MSGSSTFSRSYDNSSHTSRIYLGCGLAPLNRSQRPKKDLANQSRATSSPAESISFRTSDEWALECSQQYCEIPPKVGEGIGTLLPKTPGGWPNEDTDSQSWKSFQRWEGSLAVDEEAEEEYSTLTATSAPVSSESEEVTYTSDGRGSEEETLQDPGSGLEFQNTRNRNPPPPGIVHSVFSLMEKTIDLHQGQDMGYVYSASLEGCPGYVKIGRTSQIDRRLTANDRSFPWKLINIPDESYHLVQHFKRVESLILMDLKSERRKCKIGSGMHTEFVEMNEPRAHLYVKKWRDWMDWLPYDRNGGLRKKWRKRINYFSANQANCRVLLAVHDTSERWDPFMRPSLWMSLCIEVHAFLHGDGPNCGKTIKDLNGMVLLGVSLVFMLLCWLDVFPIGRCRLSLFSFPQS